MASAWGISWLGAWASSWGPLHEVDEVQGGGGGGGRSKKKKDSTRNTQETDIIEMLTVITAFGVLNV